MVAQRKATGRRRGLVPGIKFYRQIRSLLYDQGYTIGGARLKLTGEEVADDNNQSQQIVRQMRTELEELLVLFKR